MLLICIVGSGQDNPKCVTFAPTHGRYITPLQLPTHSITYRSVIFTRADAVPFPFASQVTRWVSPHTHFSFFIRAFSSSIGSPSCTVPTGSDQAVTQY